MTQLEKAFRGLELLKKKKPIIKEITYNLLATRQTVTLCRTDKNVAVIMQPLNEDEERRIDKSNMYYGEMRYIRGNKHIRGKDIYMYGEVDVDSDSDMDIIDKFNLIPKEGGWMYSNFDYDKGTYTTQNKTAKQYPTFNPIDWFLFNYCLIGKPKRIIVYNNNVLTIK